MTRQIRNPETLVIATNLPLESKRSIAFLPTDAIAHPVNVRPWADSVEKPPFAIAVVHA